MNKGDNELEAELAALRPRDASPQLRQRIAAHRARSVPARLRWRWAVALTGGVAATWAVAFLVPGGDDRRVEHDPTILHAQRVRPTQVGDSQPTRQAYQRALARSPDDLDALLDKAASAAQRPNPESVRICAFYRSAAELSALLGED